MHACALNDYVSVYQTMPQAWYMFSELMGYALVQQSLVLMETELCVYTGGETMGMHTAGCLSTWQPCETIQCY